MKVHKIRRQHVFISNDSFRTRHWLALIIQQDFTDPKCRSVFEDHRNWWSHSRDVAFFVTQFQNSFNFIKTFRFAETVSDALNTKKNILQTTFRSILDVKAIFTIYTYVNQFLFLLIRTTVNRYAAALLFGWTAFGQCRIGPESWAWQTCNFFRFWNGEHRNDHYSIILI